MTKQIEDDAATRTANTVAKLGASVGGGAALPAAVYAAAATFGTAGTGAAISTLSGAVAVNATTALIGVPK